MAQHSNKLSANLQRLRSPRQAGPFSEIRTRNRTGSLELSGSGGSLGLAVPISGAERFIQSKLLGPILADPNGDVGVENASRFYPHFSQANGGADLFSPLPIPALGEDLRLLQHLGAVFHSKSMDVSLPHQFLHHTAGHPRLSGCVLHGYAQAVWRNAGYLCLQAKVGDGHPPNRGGIRQPVAGGEFSRLTEAARQQHQVDAIAPRGEDKLGQAQNLFPGEVGIEVGADRLNELYREDYEKYVKVWPDISLFMKFGAMNNDKFFAQIKDILIFRVAGSPADKPEYVTLKAYLERTRDKQNKRVYYATDEAAQSAYIDLHRSQGLEVIMLDSWIDSHFSSFLEREYKEEGIQFKRVDSELDETLVDKDKAAEIVDPVTQKTRSQKLIDLFRQALGKDKLQIQAEALKSESVPAMILLPETLRRLQELNAVIQQKPLEFLEEHTLVLNTAHPLIQNLQSLADQGRDPDLVHLICNHIYDLALITQKSFDPAAVRAFVQRSNEVLTRLTRRQ